MILRLHLVSGVINLNAKYPAIILTLVTSLLIFPNSCTFDESDADNGNGNGNLNPYVPNTPSPVDGAINVDNSVRLAWQSANAESYDIIFDDNNPPSVIIENNTTENFKDVIAPGLGVTYYWQVIAHLPGGAFSAGPVWSFVTRADGAVSPGYIMILHGLTVEPPSNVRVLFQVLDLAENGVDYLTADDFEIYENGELVSNLESNLRITKSDVNNYKFQSLLMLDNSTSITSDPLNPANLDVLKSAAKYFANNMSAQQEIAVYEFSSSVTQLIDFTGYSNSGDISNAIDNINVGSPSTDLYGATITGADRLVENITGNEITQSAMVLFTDGDDTQDSHTLSQALNSIHDKSVYTVGLGTDINPEILSLIGNEGFYQIANLTQLIQQFDIILEDIDKLSKSFYWMEYVSPKRGNLEHRFLLRIKNNPVSSDIDGTFTSAGFVDAVPGIYFNTSFIFPYGKTEYNLLSGGDDIEIITTTVGGDSEPRYTWNLQAGGELILTGHNQDYSVVTIKAFAGITDQTTVTATVTDVPNNDAMDTFSDSINFVIYPN